MLSVVHWCSNLWLLLLIRHRRLVNSFHLVLLVLSLSLKVWGYLFASKFLDADKLQGPEYGNWKSSTTKDGNEFFSVFVLAGWCKSRWRQWENLEVVVFHMFNLNENLFGFCYLILGNTRTQDFCFNEAFMKHGFVQQHHCVQEMFFFWKSLLSSKKLNHFKKSDGYRNRGWGTWDVFQKHWCIYPWIYLYAHWW